MSWWCLTPAQIIYGRYCVTRGRRKLPRNPAQGQFLLPGRQRPSWALMSGPLRPGLMPSSRLIEARKDGATVRGCAPRLKNAAAICQRCWWTISGGLEPPSQGGA